MRLRSLTLCLVSAFGCGADETGVPQGAASVPEAPRFTVLADATHLSAPRDLAFNPRFPADLWVVNAGDNSVTIIHDATTSPRPEWRRDTMHSHFMPRPSALAFGGDDTTIGTKGTFASTQESDNGGNDFMGPTLWASDLDVFARMNGKLGSHLDMLHCSPLAMGIAWERDNVYWVFGGRRPGGADAADITRYDFGRDHGIGEDDHSDNSKRHYVVGEVARVPGVPSHLAFHQASRALYIADSGNGRVVRLDTTSGTPGAPHRGPEPSPDDRFIERAKLEEVVSPGRELTRPSGIELGGDVLFVADNEDGTIRAYDLAGRLLRSISTGLPAGALMGVTVGPDGKLYFVDALESRVLRADPPSP